MEVLFALPLGGDLPVNTLFYSPDFILEGLPTGEGETFLCVFYFTGEPGRLGPWGWLIGVISTIFLLCSDAIFAV